MSEGKLQGVVHVIEPTKSYGQKGFRKRLVVLEQDNGRFPNYIPVEFVQDSCDQADSLRIGNVIEVHYRLSGRKWQRDPQSEVKYFLSCEASNFRVLDGAAPVAGNPNDEFAEAAYEGDDDVPF